MILLAFDTTGERLSLALDDGRRIRARLARPALNQDEALPREIDKLLAAAKLAPRDVDAWVAASGPGRFTGIRVGLTFATLAAKSLGKKALGVSWLEALARKAERDGLLAVVLPGWKGEFFFQVFRKSGVELAAVRPPRWTEPRGLEASLRADLGGEQARLLRPERWSAADLLPAAKARLAAGALEEPAPLYVKRPHYEKA